VLAAVVAEYFIYLFIFNIYNVFFVLRIYNSIPLMIFGIVGAFFFLENSLYAIDFVTRLRFATDFAMLQYAIDFCLTSMIYHHRPVSLR
jgi:hypothetical protein